MTDPSSHDPTRLLEADLRGPSGLRDQMLHDLELVRAARVDYSLDAGLARFEATLAGASTLPSGGTVAGFAVLRWFLAAGALVSVGVVAWLLGSAQPTADSNALAQAPSAAQFRSEDGKVAEIDSTTPVVGDPSSVADTQLELAPALGVGESVAEPQQAKGQEKIGAPLGSDGGEPEGQLAATPRPTSKSLVSPEPEDLALDEAKLIDAARKALTDDPARTLALTKQAGKRFPKGAMIQEQRGYAILALLALDRRDEAEAQATEYLERWPKGPLSRRIRDGLGLLP